MKKIFLLLALYMLFFTGCSEDVVMRVKKDAERKSVSISKDIQAPGTMSNLHGLRMSDFLLFPILEHAEINRKEGETIAALMKQHNIDISEIVLNTFTEMFDAFGPYRIDDHAKTSIQLKISRYGLSDPGDFYSTQRLPYLSLNVQVLNEAGEVLWEYFSYEYAKKGSPEAVETDEILENPGMLRKIWAHEARIVSKKIIDRMPADLIAE